MASSNIRVEINSGEFGALFESSGMVGKYFSEQVKKVETLAKQLCPVDTGALRDSITSEVDGEVAVISATEDYALFVEYGTQHMAAQPFLRPAIGAISGGDAGALSGD